MIGLASLSALALVVAAAGRLDREVVPNGYVPTQAVGESGKEWVLVFVGSSTCAAVRTPGLAAAVDRIKVSLQQRAEHAGIRFATVGVSVDWNIRDGIAFLERFGQWDQVMTGRSWLNEGAVDFIWRDMPGEAALPQMLLLERWVSPDSLWIQVSDDRIIARKLGSNELIDWLVTLDESSDDIATPKR